MRNHLATSRSLLLLAAFAAVAAAAACDDESPTHTEETLLDRVRTETMAFQSTSAASQAGYEADGHCVEHPELGGMGDHWVNEGLVDPDLDPLVPEALLYATGDDGPELIAVEYIVIDAGQDRPDFDGQPFDEGGVAPLEEADVDHWSLHVWVHRENPSGTFAPFNPDVSCG